MINIGKGQERICRFTILLLKVGIYDDINFHKKGVVKHVTWTCIHVFLLCECDLKGEGWNKNHNGWFPTLDVTSEKCQTRRRLIIMNNRRAAFYFLLFFYFFVFLLFVGYEVWFVFFKCLKYIKKKVIKRNA
jgi:hypothetical protein